MKERRQFPRATGKLHLRYGRAHPESTIAWMEAGIGDAEHAPEPYIDFSETSIAFDDAPECAKGDTVTLEFGVPGRPELWRATGVVVRVTPLPGGRRNARGPATHRVAVRITGLEEGGRATLRAYVAELNALEG